MVGTCGGRAIDAVGFASRRGALAAQTLERPGKQFAPSTPSRSPTGLAKQLDAPLRRVWKTSSGALNQASDPRASPPARHATSRDPNSDACIALNARLEWPEGEAEPTNTGSRPCPGTPLAFSVTSARRARARQRRNKSDLGLARFEGRGWRDSIITPASASQPTIPDPLESASPPSPPLAPRETCPFRPFSILTHPRSVPNATSPTRSRRSQALDDRPSKIALSMPMLPSRLWTPAFSNALAP